MFTKKIAAALATFVISAPAFASNVSPLLRSTANSGFTMPQYMYGSVCEIFPAKVVITKTFGSPTIGYTNSKTIQIQGNIQSLIATASQEAVEEQPTPCDGPSFEITGRQILPTDAVQNVVLKSSGGCGTPSQTRNGPATTMLLNLIDSLCGSASN